MGKRRKPTLRFVGFDETHTEFDPNDPHTAIAERERKAICDRLLVALTMNADRDLGALSFSGILMGTMTGCACGMIASYSGKPKDLEAAFLATAKEAFFMARATQNNPTSTQEGE